MDDPAEQNRIAKILNDSGFSVISATFGVRVEEKLRSIYSELPCGRLIDWARHEDRTTSVEWGQLSDIELANWGSTTTAGQHEFGLLYSGFTRPLIVGEFSAVLLKMDELVWRQAGQYLLIGTSQRVNEDAPSALTSDVIEFDGIGCLYGWSA